MNWKTDLRLADLDANTVLEATCKRCGLLATRSAASYQSKYGHLYLDEFENRLRCSDRRCRGRMRMSMEHQHAIEGFVGGMA
jgi:hypothetical protein